MAPTQWSKDPDATLDYSIDWTAWLEDGDSITDSAWTADTGIVIESDSITGAVATVWLSGGTLMEVYRVTNRVTTSAGRIDDRSFTVTIYNR